MLVLRRHSGPDRAGGAEVGSPCGRYRYALARHWGPGAGRLVCVLLNPSTATESADDPTLRRCTARARALELDGVVVVNLFAWRARDPAALARVADPVGPATDAVLAACAARAAIILCGWGTGGGRTARAQEVEGILRATGRPIRHLGLTASGAPRHPLYVPGAAPLQPWPAARA
jgi:hypothetical protein